MGRAGLPSRAITCPPPPPPPPLLQREFQSERARGLLPGRNHPAQRRGVGRRHLTARPRPPRVRGGGSVCSVTNGPSRPARPLARARRGPARDRSSQQMPGSHRPTRRPLSGHLGGHAQIPGHLSGCMEHPVIRPHGEACWSLGGRAGLLCGGSLNHSVTTLLAVGECPERAQAGMLSDRVGTLGSSEADD